MEKMNTIYGNISNGQFLSAGYYYKDNLNFLCKMIKNDNSAAIRDAAKLMEPLIPENACLIPMPSHLGFPTYMLEVAKEIAKIRKDVFYVDCLESNTHISRYYCKKLDISAENTLMCMMGSIPQVYIPVVIENFIDTGYTANIALETTGAKLIVTIAASSIAGDVP